MNRTHRSKRCAILQSNYIPWKGYFDLINSVDEFVIYDNVQYTKNDWRNRNKIKTAQGVKWLTIPVSCNDRLNKRIDEIEIADSSWSKKHWTTISQSYSRSKHFHKCKMPFEEFYAKTDLRKLTDINLELIRIINSMLGIKTVIRNINEFAISGDRVQRLVDICKNLNADTYISGPAAKDYIDQSLFDEAGIKLEWMNYSDYPEYSQMHPPFSHAVSVLDLIFNEGEDAPKYMKSFCERVKSVAK